MFGTIPLIDSPTILIPWVNTLVSYGVNILNALIGFCNALFTPMLLLVDNDLLPGWLFRILHALFGDNALNSILSLTPFGFIISIGLPTYLVFKAYRLIHL